MHKKTTAYFWAALIGYLFKTSAIATPLSFGAKLAALANQDERKQKIADTQILSALETNSIVMSLL